jgi:MFS family permease
MLEPGRLEPAAGVEVARVSVEGTDASTPRWLLLVGCHAVLFARYVMATFLSAFFTPVATAWGISGSFNGLIFAAYPAGMALTSVVAPQLIKQLGIRWAITSGLLLTAGLTLAFGSTPDMVEAAGGGVQQYQYVFMCLYFLTGLLGSIAENAAIILATERFSDKLGTVMASIGTVSGVGCMVGPVVGGVLYDLPDSPAQAFRLPFFVCFGLCLLLVPPLHCIMPNDGIGGNASQQPEGKPVGPHQKKAVDAEAGVLTPPGRADKALSAAVSRGSASPPADRSACPLLAPSVLLGLGATLLSGLVVATLDPTLSYRLSAPPFGASASIVSLVFMYSSVVYTLCSVPIGWMVDRVPPSSRLYKATTAAGFVALAACFALLAPLADQTGPAGPASLAWLPPAELNTMWAVVLAMGLKGVGSALSNNAVYVDIVLLLPTSDKMLLATVSGLWNAAYSLGWALGPLVGGALYESTQAAELCLGPDLLSERCMQEALQGGDEALFRNASLATGLGVMVTGRAAGIAELQHRPIHGPVHAMAAAVRAYGTGHAALLTPSNETWGSVQRHARTGRAVVRSAQPDACLCSWAASNGFDGMGTWIAIASLAYGLVLLLACAFAVGELPASARRREHASQML